MTRIHLAPFLLLLVLGCRSVPPAAPSVPTPPPEAVIAYLDGDLRGAQRAFEAWAERDPRAVGTASLHLGFLAIRSGWLTAARDHFERAIEHAPSLEPLARAGLVYTLLEGGRVAEARAAFDSLLADAGAFLPPPLVLDIERRLTLQASSD